MVGHPRRLARRDARPPGTKQLAAPHRSSAQSASPATGAIGGVGLLALPAADGAKRPSQDGSHQFEGPRSETVTGTSRARARLVEAAFDVMEGGAERALRTERGEGRGARD